jgi:hypothetical protein
MNTRARRGDSPLLELVEHRKPRSDKGTVRTQTERKFVSPDSDVNEQLTPHKTNLTVHRISTVAEIKGTVSQDFP